MLGSGRTQRFSARDTGSYSSSRKITAPYRVLILHCSTRNNWVAQGLWIVRRYQISVIYPRQIYLRKKKKKFCWSWESISGHPRRWQARTPLDHTHSLRTIVPKSTDDENKWWEVARGTREGHWEGRRVELPCKKCVGEGKKILINGLFFYFFCQYSHRVFRYFDSLASLTAARKCQLRVAQGPKTPVSS